MNELHWDTISEDLQFILNAFFQSRLADEFYLAGGTALALQIGHRRSVDLDFFSPTKDVPEIRAELQDALGALEPELADSSWGNVVYLVKGVRAGFYGYGYPLVMPLVETDHVRLASLEDIALMKLDALLSRASRKDFYDLYFICHRISLRQLFELAPQKYPSVRDFETQTVKRLVYFDNAEKESDPVMLQAIDWSTVKDYFVYQAKGIGQSWIE